VTDEQERRATQSVEWLAALWELTEDGASRCANAHLLTLLQFSRHLRVHPALDDVARLRRVSSRDQLIKGVVCAAYGAATRHHTLHEALEALAADGENITGRGPWRLINEAAAEARRRVWDLTGDLDPAADLAAVVGERLPLRVVVAPSVFLPPPQAGRHGVLVRRGDAWVAHLHFGFPLGENPQPFSITRPWLLGGAWHYAIDLYLQTHWPAIARRLADRRDLADALASAVGSDPADDGGWTEILKAHVNVALKCLLSRRLSVPDGAHRAFAKARGLVLFPWFDRWLLESGATGAALAAHISSLPEALAAGRLDWECLARADTGTPPTVNLALISPVTRRACLVVPDQWPDQAVTAAVAGWRLFRLPIVRYGEWVRGRAKDASPVIAFGEPDRNPLVRRVLEQRGLSLAALDAADPAIIAISLPGFDQAPWCIAVAVTRPETSAALHVETALQQTGAYILFDAGVVVGVGRVALDQTSSSGRC
jgi:hypothetical protein